MPGPEANGPVDRPGPALRSRWPAKRTWAIALVTFRQGIRMRLWLLVPVAILILVVADVSSPRFDPVFEGVPAAVSTTLIVMAVMAVLVGVFFATYSIPSELESKIACSVCTKPVSGLEFVAGKILGMSVLLLAMLAAVGAGAYVYIGIRASEIRSLAAHRLEEARTWVAHPADLNAVGAVAQRGPLRTYHYQPPDAGPDLSILDPEGAPEGGGLKWILSNTGMRFRWDMASMPLEDWVQSGTAELHLVLVIRPPEGGSAKPLQLVVSLAPVTEGQPPNRPPQPPGGKGPQTTQKFGLPPTGELHIPLVPAHAPAGPGMLQVPAEGPIELQVYATGDGLLVGAGPDSAGLVPAAGQSPRSLAGLAVVIPLERGRQWLVGRSRWPRQQAAFRYRSVSPQALSEGDTAVEIGFSLDSWGPPTIASAAQATFVNPQTGKTCSLQFTPEGHHSTLLYIDQRFWHGGALEVRLESQTDDDFMGLVPESVRMQTDGGPFALNLAKVTLNVWCMGTVIAAFGTLLSTRLSWFVSILGGVTFVLFAFSRDFVRQSTVIADVAEALIKWGSDWPNWLHWEWLVNHLLPPVPNLQSILPGESVRMGEAMALADLGDAFLWSALAVIAMALMGAWLFRKREVAA